jgi:hypothetical protein
MPDLIVIPDAMEQVNLLLLPLSCRRDYLHLITINFFLKITATFPIVSFAKNLQKTKQPKRLNLLLKQLWQAMQISDMKLILTLTLSIGQRNSRNTDTR